VSDFLQDRRGEVLAGHLRYWEQLADEFVRNANDPIRARDYERAIMNVPVCHPPADPRGSELNPGASS